MWVILAIAAVLLFWSLGDRCLWQDEAETALLAQGILRTGLPNAQNGLNTTTQSQGREYGPDFIWRWSPWMQFYIAAGSMRLFGPTTLAARLPFAGLGMVAVLVTYLLARRLFASLGVARLSALLLTLSVSFLLQTRQARWCAVAYLLMPLLFLALARLSARQRLGVVGFVITAGLLFYTNYFIAIGLLFAIALLAPVCLGFRLVPSLAAAYGLLALLVLPGMLYFNVLGKARQLDGMLVWDQFRIYVGYFATYLLPLPVLAVLLVVTLRKGTMPKLAPDCKRWICLFLGVSALFLLFLAVGPWQMFRYLSVLLPVAAIETALAIYWLWNIRARLAVLALAILIATDLCQRVPLAIINAPGTRSADEFASLSVEAPALDGEKRLSIALISFPLLGYLYEITHHVDDPECVVAEYLREYARPQDVVIASYGDLPLQFYTGLQVLGGLQGKPLPLDADWIFRRQFYMSADPGDDRDTINFLVQRVDLTRYEAIDLPGSEVFLGNNPDPLYHCFRNRENQPILLYHKIGR